MKTLILPSQKTCLAMFSYDPIDGTFLWKYHPDRSTRFNGRYAGTPAFISIDTDGYHTSRFTNPDNDVRGRYRASRIAFKIMTGRDPVELIDHRDRNRANDAWDNLREATVSQNGMNSERGFGASRFQGVYRHKVNPSWIAQAQIKGEKVYIGSYKCEATAARARDEIVKAEYGEFAVLNFNDGAQT